MTNGILLSRECVEENDLKIGDTVIGKIWDPNYDNPEVEMELVGIFDIVADKEDEANMYDDSSLWDFAEYAFAATMPPPPWPWSIPMGEGLRMRSSL